MYYIDKIYELSNDVLKKEIKYCFNTDKEEIIILFSSGNIYIKRGYLKLITKLFSSTNHSISLESTKYKNTFVKGLLNLYFNCYHFKAKFKDNYREPGIVITNSKKNKYYFATLTSIKPIKTREYIDNMKLLDADFKTYEDVFGNEIDFREKI